ncbi:MAG: DNA repair protein RadC [Sphaerochaetaceae bacterium]|nr:DNA repair protein RadC [Sphaerochaetaceae bacterium]
MKYENRTIDYRSIKEMPVDKRPRERLQNLGARSVSDIELLCIILGSGSQSRPVQDIASDILDVVDKKGEQGVSTEDLKAIPGLGLAKASSVCACLELGRRLTFWRGRFCNSPEQIFDLIRHYGDRMQEHFLCVMLNGAHELMGISVVTVGLVNRTLVHPREVFADPLKNRATAIVIAHNHPSGNLDPSPDDLEVTYRIRKAGMLLGIEVLDHIVFSTDGYHSMKEQGEFQII